ncbi:MAG: 3-hydroxyacyl-CoA dehydrogenase family protein [Desertimonas sp.]
MSIETVAVIGAGVMGAGIAQTLAQAGCTVRGYDVEPAQLEQARATVEGGRYGLVRAVERGKLDEPSADAVRRRLSFTHVLDEAVAGVDLVIEAIPENLGLKIGVFRQLDEVVAPGAVLASNSSGLPIVALAGATGRPERVLGWHWASPPPVMRLAEIVVTETTDPAAVADVVALGERCGKAPVVVKDNPMAWGYVGNRIWSAALREARAVVAEGIVDRDGVDTILTSGWNWPVGPFAMIRGASEGWGDDRRSSVADINP